MSERYDLKAAARYWGEERLQQGDELAIVLSLREPREVNEAYHRWESSLVLETLGGIRGRRILDLACGLGRLTVPLAKAGAHVVALDNAPGMLARCERAAQRARVAGRVELFQGPAWQIPAKDASLDGVVCVGLLEHLPPAQQRQVLEEIHRVLKRGAPLATVLNNPLSVLLQAKTDNRFRKGHQFPNGYYCALVDRSGLLKRLASRFRVEPLGSNTVYSVFRQVFRQGESAKSGAALRKAAFRLATQLDLKVRSKGSLDGLLADHTFFRAIKTR
jgi:ubiquinone/menaquinone biosynthesis C-methylase UbiE